LGDLERIANAGASGVLVVMQSGWDFTFDFEVAGVLVLHLLLMVVAVFARRLGLNYFGFISIDLIYTDGIAADLGVVLAAAQVAFRHGM